MLNEKSEELHRVTNHKREGHYAIETLSFLNQLKLMINLWRALMSALGKLEIQTLAEASAKDSPNSNF